MENKKQVDPSSLLTVNWVGLVFNRHSDQGELGEFLTNHGFTDVRFEDGHGVARANPFTYCTYDKSLPKRGAFEMFRVGPDRRKVVIERGQTRYVGECISEGSGQKAIELSVSGDVHSSVWRVSWHVVAIPATPESLAHLQVAEKQIDLSNKLEVLTSMLKNTSFNPVEAARLIEDLLAGNGTAEEQHCRDGRIHELAALVGISTSSLNKVRATLKLHPDLQKLVLPTVPASEKIPRDAVTFLVHAPLESQVGIWEKVKGEKTSHLRVAQLRKLVGPGMKFSDM